MQHGEVIYQIHHVAICWSEAELNLRKQNSRSGQEEPEVKVETTKTWRLGLGMKLVEGCTVGVEPQIGGFPPKIINVNRVFHYFHHPF